MQGDEPPASWDPLKLGAGDGVSGRRLASTLGLGAVCRLEERPGSHLPPYLEDRAARSVLIPAPDPWFLRVDLTLGSGWWNPGKSGAICASGSRGQKPWLDL